MADGHWYLQPMELMLLVNSTGQLKCWYSKNPGEAPKEPTAPGRTKGSNTTNDYIGSSPAVPTETNLPTAPTAPTELNYTVVTVDAEGTKGSNSRNQKPNATNSDSC